jgi:hypothetical protein
MSQIMPRVKQMALALAGSAALVLGLGLAAGSENASAMPLVTAGPQLEATIAEPARIYRRGRTPIYPYYYNPGRPGGYSFYFGFVPYAPGDIENQALKRQFYPQDIEWPPGLYGGPRPGLGPKRWD